MFYESLTNIEFLWNSRHVLIGRYYQHGTHDGVQKIWATARPFCEFINFAREPVGGDTAGEFQLKLNPSVPRRRGVQLGSPARPFPGELAGAESGSGSGSTWMVTVVPGKWSRMRALISPVSRCDSTTLIRPSTWI